MPTPEQEREFVAQLEHRSVGLVRHQLANKEIPSAYESVAWKWISDKELEAERRNEAAISEQTEAANRAAEAATRASVAAERQAIAAERANTRATIALVIAAISAIIAIIGILVPHLW
jgi:hypothetical protein